MSLPFAFWRHGLEICHAELGARGLPGCEAPEALCGVFLQHTHLPLVSRFPEVLPSDKPGDELLAAPVRFLYLMDLADSV